MLNVIEMKGKKWVEYGGESTYRFGIYPVYGEWVAVSVPTVEIGGSLYIEKPQAYTLMSASFERARAQKIGERNVEIRDLERKLEEKDTLLNDTNLALAAANNTVTVLKDEIKAKNSRIDHTETLIAEAEEIDKKDLRIESLSKEVDHLAAKLYDTVEVEPRTADEICEMVAHGVKDHNLKVSVYTDSVSVFITHKGISPCVENKYNPKPATLSYIAEEYNTERGWKILITQQFINRRLKNDSNKT